MAVTPSSPHDTPTGEARDERDARALTECMTVLPQERDSYTVVGENGGTYRVTTRTRRCTCPDHKHRGVRCKHQRRVAFATGERPIPTWADADAVDPLLGEQVEGGPRFEDATADKSADRSPETPALATDGGQEELPEHLTRMSTIDGDDVVHCQSCGGEGDSPDSVDHHEQCPEAAGREAEA